MYQPSTGSNINEPTHTSRHTMKSQSPFIIDTTLSEANDSCNGSTATCTKESFDRCSKQNVSKPIKSILTSPYFPPPVFVHSPPSEVISGPIFADICIEHCISPRHRLKKKNISPIPDFSATASSFKYKSKKGRKKRGKSKSSAPRRKKSKHTSSPILSSKRYQILKKQYEIKQKAKAKAMGDDDILKLMRNNAKCNGYKQYKSRQHPDEYSVHKSLQ
eukprot:47116_1